MSTQSVAITEYLEIDLNSERWHCRRCGHDIGSARCNYKEGLLVYNRDPQEVHHPILDASYPFTYAPDPKWCRIIEFYCPSCGTLIENEYLPPGHPLTHDIDLDLDKLKARHAQGETQAAGQPAGQSARKSESSVNAAG